MGLIGDRAWNGRKGATQAAQAGAMARPLTFGVIGKGIAGPSAFLVSGLGQTPITDAPIPVDAMLCARDPDRHFGHQQLAMACRLAYWLAGPRNASR